METKGEGEKGRKGNEEGKRAKKQVKRERLR